MWGAVPALSRRPGSPHSGRTRALRWVYCFGMLACNRLDCTKWQPGPRCLQPHPLPRPPLQVWRHHGAWVTAHRPSFGPGIRERFEAAAGISEAQFAAAVAQRAALRQRVVNLLGGDGVLALPTAPGPAPLRGTPAEQLDAFRTSLISLNCIAGLAGCPQVGAGCSVG